MAKEELGKLQGRRMIEQNTARTTYEGEFEKEAAAHRADLEKIIENGIATKIRILTNHDSCPVCKAYEGAYQFDEVPALPLEGCSHPLGCRCHYAPILDMHGP